MMNRDIRRKFFARKIREWRKNPILFFREALHFEPDDWQIEVALSLRDNPRTSVKSGQGVGKTAATAALILWFLVCFPFSKVVATAPTKRQLIDVLWSEIAVWMNKSPLLQAILDPTATYIRMIGAEKVWFAAAVASSKPENIAGSHADNLLFVVDEASGVDDKIIETINGTLSGKNNKLLLLGNPTKAEGSFYESHTSARALYSCFTVNAEESPRTNKENIEAMAQKYGRDSNVYRVRVLGEFPLNEDDVLIPIGLVEQSIMTDWEEPEIPEHIRICADVARFGSDKTIISQRVDKKIDIIHKRNGMDTVWTANVILREYIRLLERYPDYDGLVVACVDDGGVGGGVTDNLRRAKREDPVTYARLVIVPVQFGLPLGKKSKLYYDTTSLMMGVLRDELSTKDDKGNPKECGVILPNDSELVAQLSTRKYEFRGPKIKVEGKDEFKKRTEKTSPDEADSVIMCVLPLRFAKRKEAR